MFIRLLVVDFYGHPRDKKVVNTFLYSITFISRSYLFSNTFFFSSSQDKFPQHQNKVIIRKMP